METPTPIGIYVHWPFCLAKCPYCDFNSHVREKIDQQQWKDAYLTSLRNYAGQMDRRQVASVFFGGGTPSLMPPDTMGAIIDEIQKLWPVANDVEITMEANPTSVEAEKFRAFKQAGINRVSIGVQALNDQELKFLGRQHNSAEALNAVEVAQKNEFRYSMDLIYARPNQTLKNWQQELEIALQYAGKHLSLYQLTIERGTVFFQDYSRGVFEMPSEDLSADFYNLTQDIMEAHGLPAYEVSNHASEGEECRHNMIYWRYQDYVGVGPGAHGRLTLEGEKVATREHLAPEIWLDMVKQKGSGAHPYQKLSVNDQKLEALMMGLRLREGIEVSELIEPSRLDQAIGQGWAVEERSPTGGQRLYLTREGLLRLNSLLPFLLREQEAVERKAAGS